MIHNEELSNLYNNWWSNRTPEQYKLQLLCFDYEEKYFEDMLLKEGSLLNDYIETVLNHTNGIFLGTVDELRLYIVDSDKFNGCFYRNEQKIEISRPYINDQSVILHELIHYFEYQLEKEVQPFIRELLVIELYNKLLPKISDLKERIFNHCEWYSYTETFEGHGGMEFYSSLKALI